MTLGRGLSEHPGNEVLALSEARLPKAVFVQLAIKSAAIDAENVGCAAFLPRGTAKNFFDVGLLHRLQSRFFCGKLSPELFLPAGAELRQVLRSDFLPRRQKRRLLHHILQRPRVARPEVAAQEIERRSRKPGERAAVLPRELPQEMLCQKRDCPLAAP